MFIFSGLFFENGSLLIASTDHCCRPIWLQLRTSWQYVADGSWRVMTVRINHLKIKSDTKSKCGFWHRFRYLYTFTDRQFNVNLSNYNMPIPNVGEHIQQFQSNIKYNRTNASCPLQEFPSRHKHPTLNM
jgi:hypothetical protein